MLVKILAAFALAATLAGCASSPSSFRLNKDTLSDTEVCRTAFAADKGKWSARDANEVVAELAHRRLDRATCESFMRRSWWPW